MGIRNPIPRIKALRNFMKIVKHFKELGVDPTSLPISDLTKEIQTLFECHHDIARDYAKCLKFICFNLKEIKTN